MLWPLFQKLSIQDRRFRLVILWPFYRYLDEISGTERLWQWWVWPLVARTIVEDRQWAWSFLWPIIWLREYFDPEGRMVQTWIVPIFWRVKREHRDGDEAEFVKVWPLFHYQADFEGKGNWSVFSPAAWRRSNFDGFEEAYGWIWTLARGQHRKADDSSFELIMNLYTTRKRGTRRTGSMPVLFNFESEDDGSGVLRLLQFIPISWGGPSDGKAPASERKDR